MAELRIRDLEDSIRPDEIRYMVTQEGDCHHDEVKVGAIRRGNDGLGMAWIRCPLSAANKIAEKKRVQMGQQPEYSSWSHGRYNVLSAYEASARARWTEVQCVIDARQ